MPRLLAALSKSRGRPRRNPTSADICVLAEDCDDGNECTLDSCGAGGVCAHDPVADGIPCGDGGSCQSGVCVTPECSDGLDNDCDDPIDGDDPDCW